MTNRVANYNKYKAKRMTIWDSMEKINTAENKKEQKFGQEINSQYNLFWFDKNIKKLHQ